ncbi:toll/interleukin-1 receptor domain-containing protein [Streptomyces sp. G-5]|uniref:toll/interleukin-1 receptor domain-containing protein n=1 Tax=Streptomyces sp. G-5 TaxID=2977231 RepID=UPI0021CECA95|nr:toll/interleukin-1 receptor domain-containing protein [Streptomyces sp. G-5]MCU4745494.1 toll/interleukin-1 receptor domain-containing protein [Streptomyces sp. G-5]
MAVAPEVFPNYRTGDEEMAATLIQGELARRFGGDHVFFASRSIAPGEDYTHRIEDALRRCRVVLAVMGPRWAQASGDAASRSPGQRHDWAHHEILRAREYDVPVLPVLVGRQTHRLRRSNLPRELGFLADRQYMRFDHRNAVIDLDRIGDEVLHCVPALSTVERDHHPPASSGFGGPGGGNCYHFHGDMRGAHLHFWSR